MRDPSMGRALRFAPGQLHFVPLSKIAPGDFVEPKGSNLASNSKTKRPPQGWPFCFVGWETRIRTSETSRCFASVLRVSIFRLTPLFTPEIAALERDVSGPCWS